VIWTGANDGPFHVTRDGGTTWQNVTPKDLPPGGRVAMIEPSPHRRGSAYYAVYRYLLGDFAPYIYRTNDYGRTWTRLTPGNNGIPADYPTRVVREDPDRAGLLYAGTEFGMFVSFDDGARWQRFSLNMPVVPINDMKVHRKDLIVATQGRGFWILDNLTPLHQATARVASAPAHLFRPDEAYRTRYSGGGRSRLGSAAPQYPPPGAAIDYSLAAAPQGGVRLEILDADGDVIRSFSSQPAPRRDDDDDDDDMRPGRRGGGPPRLTENVGVNRFVWDLRYPGPWQASARGPGGNGPTAVPGTYTARLTAGDYTATQPLVVLADPRNTRDGVTLADLREQFEVGMRVRELVSDVNRLVARVREAKGRLKDASGAAADTLKRVTEIERKLVTPPIRYSKPELQAHINYLYGLTNEADQKPGRDVHERYAVLRRDLDSVIAETNRLLGPTTPVVGASP
jgi:hypothetical protein